MTTVPVSENTIEAAGVAVNVMNASRRVGWGKAFDAMRRADSAERDLNGIRGDIMVLANFGARAYGALKEILDDDTRRIFRGDDEELSSFFAEGPVAAGRDAVRNLPVTIRRRQETKLRQIAERYGQRSMKKRLSEDIILSALSNLAECFGMPDRWSLIAYLAAAPTHSCGECGCYPEANLHFSPTGWFCSWAADGPKLPRPKEKGTR